MKLMLANQRFLAHHFDEALVLYTELIQDGQNDPKILRRRLICEIVAGSIESAVSEAVDLLKNTPNELLQFIPGDDCPCDELIAFIEKNDLSELGKFRRMMLSLYGCKHFNDNLVNDLLLSQNSKYRQWTKEITELIKENLCSTS